MKTKRKLVSLLLGGAIALFLCVQPVLAEAGVQAQGSFINYQEASWNSGEVTYTGKTADCTPVTEDTATWTAGWYAVSGSVTISAPVTVDGEVNLILTDGCTLTAAKGIVVPVGSSLKVYAQFSGSGTLNATGTTDSSNNASAGIGGSTDSCDSGSIAIHGGVINATGSGETGFCGGAGIGGGASSSGNGGSSGAVTIYGGTIKAASGEGNYNGAGIGGGGGNNSGGNGSNITIYGGSVTAESRLPYSGSAGIGGAGIGGGGGIYNGGTGNHIAIYGGTVHATGGVLGAGIGGGGGSDNNKSGDGTNITISGGTVAAVGGNYAAGIGGGGGYQNSIQIGSSVITCTTTGGIGTVAISGGIVNASSPTDVVSAGYEGAPIGNGGNQSTAADIVKNNAIVFENGVGAVCGDVVFDESYEVPADYSLTIPADASLCGSGTLSGGGTFTAENLTEEMVCLPALYYNGQDRMEEITKITDVSNGITICGQVFTVSGWTVEVAATDEKTYTATYANESIPAKNFTKTITIQQSGTQFDGGVKTYNGEEMTAKFTIGDTITVKAVPKATGTAPNRAASRTVPAQGQMVVFYGQSQISEPARAAADGVYTMTVTASSLPEDARNKEITLTVKYIGTDDMAGAETTVQVTVGEPLPAPADPVWLENGMASWGASENASGYTVLLYKEDIPIGTAVSVTDTRYRFPVNEAGRYSFKVKATSETYADSPEAESGSLSFYSVSFDTGGAEAIAPQIVADGGKASKPADPVKTGSAFAGWHSGSGFAQPWDFENNPVLQSITLFAKWEANTYAVTVQTQGSGTASASHAFAAAGTEVALTAVPENGWHFKEWQVLSGGAAISSSRFIMPAADITVKAVFEKDSSGNSVGTGGSTSSGSNSGTGGNTNSGSNSGTGGSTNSGSNSGTGGSTSSGSTGSSTSSGSTGSSTSSGSNLGSVGSTSGNSGSSGSTGTNKPSLKDNSGRQGWDVIRAAAEKAASAPEGGTVAVDMNGSALVPGSVFAAIRGKAVTVSFDMGGGISWSVNGKEVTAAPTGDTDFSVKAGASAIPKELLDASADGAPHLELSLAHNGAFGFTAALTVQIGSRDGTSITLGGGAPEKYAGMYANLFYYHPAKRSLEYICTGQVGKDGIVRLPFAHASDYTVILSQKPLGGTDAPETPPSAQDEPGSPQDAGADTHAQVTSVRLSKTVYTYSGKAKKPSVIAFDADGRRISGRFYTVVYKNNRKVGTATAAVTFKNGYSGTVKRTFTIRPAGTSIKKIKPSPGGFTVAWAKKTVQTSGYQIQYSEDAGFQGSTVHSVFVKKASITKQAVKNRKAGKNYAVRIRTYYTVKKGGKKTRIFSAWSSKVWVKTLPAVRTP